MEVCYELEVKNIDTPTKAHIHEGAKGVAGGIVVTLDAPTDGQTSGCAVVDKDLLKRISDTPANFYVNVHNDPFPNGAVRGQLG